MTLIDFLFSDLLKALLAGCIGGALGIVSVLGETIVFGLGSYVVPVVREGWSGGGGNPVPPVTFGDSPGVEGVEAGLSTIG